MGAGWRARAAILVLAGLAAGAGAAQVEVKEHGCQRGVELIARDAPLVTVLERLATTLRFRLDVEGVVTGTVNRRTRGEPARLLADLLGSQPGHVIWYASDPHCPQQLRLARVWLLSGTPAAASRAPVQLPPVAAPIPARENYVATPQQLSQADQDARRRKGAYDAHVRAHGEPPPGVPEEATQP